jgi:inorganic pyrophosphatase
MDETIEAVIEIPRGSRNKYEIDEETGQIRLDRVLFSSVHYPTDYGYFPDTRADDGDHLDVLVLVQEPTFPGCRLTVRPVGVLRMRDEAGEDFKVLAVPVADPRYVGYTDIEDVHPHWLREIENFFNVYKQLEPEKIVSIERWGNREEAWQAIRAAQTANG